MQQLSVDNVFKLCDVDEVSDDAWALYLKSFCIVIRTI